MDDSNPSPFDRLLEAAERGGPAPAGLSADESIDMAIARRLFALRIDTAAPGEQPWQMHAVARVPAIRGEDTAIVAPLSVSSAGASTQGDLTASASALSMAPAPATTTPVSVDPHPVLTLWDRRVTIALALAVAAGVFAILWRQGLPPAVRPMAQVTPAVAATQRELPASIGGSATAMPSARAIGGQPAARSSDGASEVVRGIAPGIPQEDAPVVPSFRPVAEATDHPLPNGNAHAPVDDGATASPVATVPGTATTTFAGTATTGIPTPVATTSSVPGPPTAVGSATPTSPMAMLQSRPGVNTSPVFRVWHAPVAGR